MDNLSIGDFNIGGNCPVQAEGVVNGKPFYFRARGEKWSMSIGGNDVIMNPNWYYQQDYGEGKFAAGWMPQWQAFIFIGEALKYYSEWLEKENNESSN